MQQRWAGFFLAAALMSWSARPTLAQDYPAAEMLLSTAFTVAGEAIRYPSGAARVTAAIVTIEAQRETGWHRHGVPLFAYLLSGELTVDYGAKGKRSYKAGEAFMEAMDWAHAGRNDGPLPVRILVVYMGAENAPEVLPAQ